MFTQNARRLTLTLLLAAAPASLASAAPAAKPGAPARLEEPGERLVLAVLSSYRTGVSREAERRAAKTLVRVAEEKGVDPFLVLGVIRLESSGWSHARSSCDARGLMQIRPFVGKALAREMRLPWKGADSLHDPEVNLRLGVHYLAKLSARYDGDVEKMLQAYSMGPTKLDRILRRGKTAVRDYAITVQWFASNYRELAETHGDLEPGFSRLQVGLRRLEREIGGTPKRAYAIAVGRAPKDWNRTSKPAPKASTAAASRDDLDGASVTGLIFAHPAP